MGPSPVGGGDLGVKVDVATYEASGQHLGKMLKMLDYHVGMVSEVAAEIADIGGGAGYQDRASDLVRAAALWERYRADLEVDKRFFDPGTPPGRGPMLNPSSRRSGRASDRAPRIAPACATGRGL
jgi:hypothetical protein